MLINLTNHASIHWCNKEKQLAINLYNSIYDIHFPIISPHASATEVYELALQYENKIQALCPLAVLIMGEFTFSFTLVALLQQRNITCIAATCHRNTIDHPDGTKTTIFRFEQFRVYPPVANSVIPESSNLTRFHKIPNLET